ncbi:hypothetical protein KJ782_07220 [Patescibacteria group bacterium]|nr:hypothetical protein [Patescibacteria group bacterium]
MRFLMLPIAALALLATSCTQYTVTRYPKPSAELRTYAPGGVVSSNTCSGHAAEVDAVFVTLDKTLDTLNVATPARWGTKPISVCVVENHPFVQCGGNPLAGCSYNGPVFVSTLWVDPRVKDAQPPKGYDWRKTLLHEFLGTLAMRGGLRGIAASPGGASFEAALLKSQVYANVMKSATAALW